MQSDSSPFAIQKRTNLRISENTTLFRLGLVALLALHLGTDRLGAQQPTAMLDVSVGQPTAFVSPTLYGLMTEEITYSYDDDLYAEMVRNRTLQDHGHGGVANWNLNNLGTAHATMDVDATAGPSAALSCWKEWD
jgi:alpha-N-arabinofuranosidase